MTDQLRCREGGPRGLEEVEREGVFIDVCPSCNGIWFDVGELETLIENSPVPVGLSQEFDVLQKTIQSTPELGTLRNCPHCNLVMGKKNYKRFSGVIIDVCRFHGLFLDAQELEKIQLFIATGGAEKERRVAKEEERVTRKAAEHAKKRSRLNEIRSSSLRTRYSRTNAETEVYYDFLDIVVSFLRGF